MDKYKFRKYRPKYKQLFSKEKLKLKKILQKAKIEHIGSTAVPKLGGKGIIDILIGVNKNKINPTKSKLTKIGYIFKPEAGEKNRLFFEKDYKYAKKIRRTHIQLTAINSKVWKNTIKVRNKLRKYPRIAKKYSEIKKRAVKISKGNGKKYRKYKKDFLNKLLR